MSTNSRLVALYYKESIFYGFSNSLEQGLQQPQPQLMQVKCKGPKPTFKFGSIYLLDELLHLNDDVFFTLHSIPQSLCCTLLAAMMLNLNLI